MAATPKKKKPAPKRAPAKKTAPRKSAPKKAAARKAAPRPPARPAAPSAPRVVRAKRSPESPAVLEGIDRSGRKSAVRELSWADFDRVVSELAQGLGRFQPEAVVGVAHGGVFVGGALAAALQVEFWPVRISRRSRDQGPVAAPGLSGTMPKELAGRRVVIVDDIAASGDTLELARALAEAAGAAKVATATIVSRPGGYEPSVCWERTADFFVFPWDYHVNATT
ncbi:MAG: phosphoribosyltransferase domain-containing protein [Myxococcaceae bacterium]|nr:phosphoribosyltransferase domain-containing protein [Myxococcaceae bacterium]